MNASRRSILKLLGVAPAAAPLAAKAAADKAIGDMAGIGLLPNAPPYVGISGSPQPLGADDWKKKVLRFLMNPTLPSWFEDDVRHRNWQVGYLDPDIASKRSWSMNVKIATQRQRNIERAKREALDGPRRGVRQREFEEKYGIWL